MKALRDALLFATPAALAATLGHAQVAAPDESVAALRAAAVMIEAGAAPVVDGDINDEIWQRATVVRDFYQLQPTPGEPAIERTEVRLLYDARQLYVAVHAHERDPGNITATTRERDARLGNDDFFQLVLDPGLSRRDGYAFTMNPAGARIDALIQSGSFVLNWNTVWAGRTRPTSDGWTAEMAIPFRSLSFDQSRTEWGIDLTRQRRRSGESARWARTPAGVGFTDLSYEGTLTGLAGMDHGRGLDVQTYGVLRTQRSWPTRATTTVGRPSATAYYKFDSGITGLLTANTDFSDAPLDNRQVNTTRFSLFEAETREFFLEDSGNFEFGRGGSNANSSGTNNGRPFFSRNIGLVNGRPIDILAGAKLSGNAGRMQVGALSVRTVADSLTPGQTLSVLRLATNVLKESRLGMIFTDGDPTGLTRNRVAGVDFNYRNSTFAPGKRLLANGYYERSDSSTLGADGAWQLGASLPNEPWAFELRAQQIGANFRPALGFVNRAGIRAYYGNATRLWRPRGGILRQMRLSGIVDRTTGLDNRLQSSEERIETEFQRRTTDSVQFALKRSVDVLPAAFTLPGAVTIRAGRYQWNRWSARLASANGRKLGLTVNVECCDYYDGSSRNLSVDLQYLPGPTFGLSLSEQLQRISLPGGNTSIRIDSLLATLNFSPQMTLVTEVKYDTVSRRLGASVRYKWQIRPTTELFATVGESALYSGRLADGSYHSQGTAFAVRIGHRLQY